MSPRSEDHIEEMKEKLYSPSSPSIQNNASRPLKPKEIEVNKEWERSEAAQAEEEAPSLELPTRPKGTLAPWIFAFIAFVFFAGSSVFAWYYIVNRAGVASNVSIEVTGPVSVKGGQNVSLDFTIENRNSFPLELVDLVVEYPRGTKDGTDTEKSLETYREGLGSVEPGERVVRTVEAVLFGAEKEKHIVTAKARYYIPNSNAPYESVKSVDLLIETAPVEFVLETLKESTIGQPVELLLRIRSNTASKLPHMLVRAEYPAGFIFESSVPAPSSGNALWDIAELEPEATTTIRIKGTFTGEAGADRFFRFQGGVPSKLDSGSIDNVFASSLEKVSLVKPFIGLDLVLDENKTDGEVVVGAGKNVSAKINWVNNLKVPITDLSIEASIDGVALDKRSLNAFSGFYRSSENKIQWTRNTNEEFLSIDPGKSGGVNFSFATIPYIASPNFNTNQIISLVISVKAKRPSESNVPEEVKSTIVKTIKIQSEVGLAARSLYYVGPFINSGPLPPAPERHTTYTVVWTLTNTSNDMTGTTVTGVLPPYVSWVGQVSPATERVEYDSKTGRVTWNAGSLPAGTGFSRASREVAFQVDLFPSVNQIGETPILIQSQTVSGMDSFTGLRAVRTLDENLSTRISTDPNYATNLDRVTE